MADDPDNPADADFGLPAALLTSARGIDGLCSVCRRELDADPFCGALFVFRNKTRTALRILAYDGQGFWMCHKRLSNGHIGQWPQNSRIDAFELQSLIWNFQPPEGAVKFFKKLS